jgi:hypothetical protein
MPARSRWTVAAALAAGLAGCGGGSETVDAGDDLAVSAPDLAVPAPALARVTSHGGPVLSAPEPWIVVWQGDEALGAKLNAFFTDMFNTDYYWTMTMAQYGVGRGTPRGVVVIPQPKPATLAHDAIPAMVVAQLANLTVNANTVLVLVVPKTTALTGLPANERAYHSQTIGASSVPYIVLQPPTMPVVGSEFDDLTFVASHELAEAASNPLNALKPAWYDDEMGGAFGEIADLCNPLLADIDAVTDGGMPSAAGTYAVARLYSESAVEGGKLDVCWHYQRGLPYYYVGATPRVIDATAGGSAVTFTVQLAAYGDVGPIEWEIDGAPAGVTLIPQSGTSHVGDTVNVQLTLGPGVTGSFPLVILGTTPKSNSVYDLLVRAN